MTPQQSYLEFAPPPTPGLLRGLLLALVAHGVLLAILAVGVHWQREAPVVTAEAELWSAIPQEAAPPARSPEPPAPEPEMPKVAPPPQPAPVAAPPQPDPNIAIEREKTKQLKDRQQRELLEKEKKLNEKQRTDKAAIDKLEKIKAQKAKELEETKKAQAAKEAKAKPQESSADTKKLAEVRAAALKRMAALAAGSGSDTSQGSATQSSGPSAGYGGRIRARIKPNITFTDTISGNPLADVEVRTSPDGTIISRRLTKSSGVKSWDDAVLSAIDKTEVLPRDVDGRVPPVLTIGFRPQD